MNYRELVRHENLRPYYGTLILKARIANEWKARHNREMQARWDERPVPELPGLCVAVSVESFRQMAVEKETRRSLAIARHFA